MKLNDLLKDKDIDPQNVIVMRHRPHEPELNKVLPWLAAEKPDMFNAYQQTQGERLESAMKKMIGDGFVASFIGHKPGKALFVGLYSIASSKPLTYEEFWQDSALSEMKEKFGMKGWDIKEDRQQTVLWFELTLTEFYKEWKGKLIVDWPTPEISWWRRSHQNDMPIAAILEESILDAAMPRWDEIELTCQQLGVLPTSWKSVLKEWRGIYYIFDTDKQKGYVGSAYGKDNLLERWEYYAASGHGGNKLLKPLDCQNFRFSILQRVSPDMVASDVIQLEGSWKKRLHTRAPFGLNDN